ncbi:ricin B-like lectin [Pholiota conissans]|uniref:Ricin B-like lectin n=1 Tax=Pholiota conissans TaxID=109636 RepID=A0A9P5YTG8_9AGAR|nr:ricin B-like lectin [Pholiota conissans]
MFSKYRVTTALLLSLSTLSARAQDQSTDLNRTYVVHNSCPGTINLFLAAELQGILASGASLTKIADVESSLWFTDANGGRFTGEGTMRTGFSDNSYWLVHDQGQINTGLKVAPRAHPGPNGTCTVAECDSATCKDTFIGVTPIFPPNATSPAPFHHCGTGEAADIAFDITFCPDGKFPKTTGIEIHPGNDDSKCLEVRGGKFANGTPVVIDDCNNKKAQNWFLTQGSTTIRAAGTDFCIDAGLEPANGTALTIARCVDHLSSQQWNFTVHSIAVQGQNQCLDVADGDLTNGVQVETIECSSSDFNQFWDI